MSSPEGRSLARDARVEPITEKRSKRRLRVFLAGKVSHGGFSTDCTIRDLNDLGAKIHVPTAIGLPEEVSLLILREGMVVRCKQIWSKPPLYGLQFIEAEDVQKSTRPQHVALKRVWLEWTSKHSR